MSWCSNIVFKSRLSLYRCSVRNFRGIKGPTKGRPPWESPSIKQIIKARNYKDPAIYYKVNIGLPGSIKADKKNVQERIRIWKNSHSKDHKVTNVSEVPLDDIYEEWTKTVGPQQIKKVAEHYGVYQDLFGDAFFYPRTALQVSYQQGDEYVPVYRGNVVKPSEASDIPVVTFDADPDTLYTLVLSNPDGHLNTQDKEYVHWFIGNITDGDVLNGEVIKKYMQPFPARGTGYHRYIFILYKQDRTIDYSDLKSNHNRVNLDDRTFETCEFYRKYQDDITPVGLSFFQTDWDSSVTTFFHETLNIQEPIFEYDFVPLPINKARWYPKRMPFNTYMDKYRDPKQIAKEILLKKLKIVHPFKKPDPPSKYPNAQVYHKTKDMPTWLKTETRKEGFGWGKIAFHDDIVNPK